MSDQEDGGTQADEGALDLEEIMADLDYTDEVCASASGHARASAELLDVFVLDNHPKERALGLLIRARAFALSAFMQINEILAVVEGDEDGERGAEE